MNSKADRERQIRKGVHVGGEPGGGPPGSSSEVREKLYSDAIVTCTGVLVVLKMTVAGTCGGGKPVARDFTRFP
jgi:hypothetical protein